MLYSPCAEDRSDTTVPGGAFQVADGGWPSCNVRQVDYFNISSDISSVQNRCWWLLNVQYIADCHNPWWGIRLTKYIIWRHQKGFQHCSYVFVCIWWFPEMGSTPKIISFNKTFHEIKAAIIYWGSPIGYGNSHHSGRFCSSLRPTGGLPRLASHMSGVAAAA